MKLPDRAGFMHMTVTGGYLHGVITERGNEPPLMSNADGSPASTEETLQYLKENPRKVFPVGTCDNWDEENGVCLGHIRD